MNRELIDRLRLLSNGLIPVTESAAMQDAADAIERLMQTIQYEQDRIETAENAVRMMADQLHAARCALRDIVANESAEPYAAGTARDALTAPANKMQENPQSIRLTV